MIALLRSLIVYCLLLALPYQGYAAAAMMACLPAAAPEAPHVAMPAGPHDHAAMVMAEALAHEQGKHAEYTAYAAASSDHSPAHASHADFSHGHGSTKCGGSGAACCIAGAPVPALSLSVPALPVASDVNSLYAAYLPAVHLAHPERPPQG